MEIEPGSLLIALSTYPRENNYKDYIKLVENNIAEYKKGRAINFIEFDDTEKNLFRNQKLNQSVLKHDRSCQEKINEIPPYQKKYNYHLYNNSLKFHLWGKYDIVFISLAENFSLSNKVFLPTRIDDEYQPGYLKTHVLSGIPLSIGNDNYEEKFAKLLGYNCAYNLKQTSFIGISNLKLNNAFCIGNGLHFISLIRDKIESLLPKNSIYFLVMSFAAFELSVVLFDEDIENIKEKILDIRELTVHELFMSEDEAKNSEIIANSILTDEEKNNVGNCIHSHVFSDSHSFFGVRLDDENDWFVKEKQGFQTQIEWEIRPGHEKYVTNFINSAQLPFLTEDCYFIPGKTDYIFKTTDNDDNLSLNYKLFQLFRNPDGFPTNQYGKLIDHVRSIRTKILFETKRCKSKEELLPMGRIHGNQEIRDLYVSTLKDIHGISKNLKRLKISRELRNRIIKVFFNFESAIQNPLFYGLFIDLSFFVNLLKQDIFSQSSKVENFYLHQHEMELKRVSDIENTLSTLIDYFEESFNIRYINNYSFDDVSDFLIGYNSPIQQIITSFDNYFKSLYSLVVPNVVARNIITRVTELQTTSTLLSVNFSIYNLYEPGILFYYATKEIYTSYFKIDINATTNIKPLEKKYNDFCHKYFLENPNSRSIHHKEHLTSFLPIYFLVDYSRFDFFFKKDFKQFMFWHLSFIIQFPSIYDSTGDFNKEQFFKEFCRLLFIAIIRDHEDNIMQELESLSEGENELILKNNCPIPQMVHIWNRTYKEIRHFIASWIIHSADYNFSEHVPKKVNTTHSLDDNDNHNEFLKCDFDFIFDIINHIDLSKLKELFIKNKYREAVYALTKKYLEEIYKTNCNGDGGIVIPSVNRNWMSGDIEDRKNYTDQSYFLFDPAGGAFFHSLVKSKEFSLIRNKVFLVLMHHAYVLKGSLFTDWKVMIKYPIIER